MSKLYMKFILIGTAVMALTLLFIINRPISRSVLGDFSAPNVPPLMHDFGTLDSGVTNYRKVAENEFLALYVQDQTSYFAVKDKRNDYTWFSNNVQPDLLARTESQRQLQRSTLLVNYLRRDNTVGTLNNFSFSINDKRNFDDAFIIEETENGFVTTYTITDREPRGYWFPPFISKERFIELVFNPVQQFGSAIDRRQLDQYYGPLEDDPDTYVIRQLRPDENTGLFNMNELSGAQVQTLFRLFYSLGTYGNQTDEFGNSTGEYHLDDVRFDNEAYDIFIDTTKPEFIIPLHITLNEDHLEVVIDTQATESKGIYQITSLRVLPYFGAIRNTIEGEPSEGQLLIPEGSGGLIEFNNQKIRPMSYTSWLYGEDIRQIPEVKPQSDVGAGMPIFGVIQPRNSMLAIIEEGDAHTRIRSDVSGKVDSYNKINAEFVFMQSGSYQLANNRISIWNLEPYNYTPTLRYYFFADENSQYVSMAHLYGLYLKHRFNLTALEAWQRRLAIDILGSYTFDDYILWVPVDAVGALTTYEQAMLMLSALENAGWTHSVVSYVGWFNGGIHHQWPSTISHDRVLGTRRERTQFHRFIDQQAIELFYDVNFMKTHDSPWYVTQRYTARVIGGQVARYFPYDLATRRMLRQGDAYTLNNTPGMMQLAERFNRSASRQNLPGISLRYLGNTLYGDFRRNNEVSRHESLLDIRHVLGQFEMPLLLRNPHQYALEHAALIVDLSTQTSNLVVVDEAIPFYQLAIAPYIEYFAPSYNMAGVYESQTYLLHLLQTGSNPKVTLSYQSTDVLAGTAFESYFDTQFDRHAAYLSALRESYEALNIGDSYLVDHVILQTNLVKVTYSQGQEFILNLGSTERSYQDQRIPAHSFISSGGIPND